MRIFRLALNRLAVSIPCVGIILLGLFLMLQLAPGDAVDALMGQMGTATWRWRSNSASNMALAAV